MNGNDFMSWILRSPFHGLLSKGMMLITVTGCKSGRKYTTPVEYFHEDGQLWVMTNRDRTWWRNLKNGAEVSLLLKRRAVAGFAELEQDVETVKIHLVEYLHHIPHAARPMGVRIENGSASGEDITRVAKDRLFVKIGQIR